MDNESADGSTLSAGVYSFIREGLMNGRYLPGQHITLRALAEQTGTSITPVREAVHRLAAERALVLEPNRSIVVPHRSSEELNHLWRLRVLVEGDTCALAASMRDEASIAEIEEAQRIAEREVEAGDPIQLMTRIAQTGLAIARASGSFAHLNMVTNLRLLSGPYTALALLNSRETSLEDLRAADLMGSIIVAIKSKDSEQARDLRRADIRKFQESITRRLMAQNQY